MVTLGILWNSKINSFAHTIGKGVSDQAKWATAFLNCYLEDSKLSNDSRTASIQEDKYSLSKANSDPSQRVFNLAKPFWSCWTIITTTSPLPSFPLPLPVFPSLTRLLLCTKQYLNDWRVRGHVTEQELHYLGCVGGGWGEEGRGGAVLAVVILT